MKNALFRVWPVQSSANWGKSVQMERKRCTNPESGWFFPLLRGIILSVNQVQTGLGAELFRSYQDCDQS